MKYLKVFPLVLAAVGCADAFRTHADVVARSGDAELTVTRLAEIVANARDVPVTRDVVELIAYRWTELEAFAQRAARGDSLVDSVTVVNAMWPDARGAAVDSFHAMVVASQVDVQSAQVDSAYRAGNHIIVGHILKAVNDSMSTEERAAQRQAAEDIRQRLVTGTWDWDRANAENDDQNAQARQGILGVLERGLVNERFENAAYALGPGELSDVVETPAGYHVVYRPALDDVRADYTETVRSVFIQRQDSVYEAHLMDAYNVSFRSNAPETIREAVQSPFRFRDSDQPLATFADGQLTVGQFIRWLHVFPPDIAQGLPRATDDQILAVSRSLVGRELIWRQADSAGISFTPEQYSIIAESFRNQLDQLRQITQLYPDSLIHYGTDDASRQELASLMVDQYLERGVQDTRLMVPVPPFLAEQIMEGVEWEVIPTGVLRATEQAASLRAAMPAAGPGGGSR